MHLDWGKRHLDPGSVNNDDVIEMVNRLEIMESINKLNNPGGGVIIFSPGEILKNSRMK